MTKFNLYILSALLNVIKIISIDSLSHRVVRILLIFIFYLNLNYHERFFKYRLYVSNKNKSEIFVSDFYLYFDIELINIMMRLINQQ